jgi:hypothetical protein
MPNGNCARRRNKLGIRSEELEVNSDRGGMERPGIVFPSPVKASTAVVLIKMKKQADAK